MPTARVYHSCGIVLGSREIVVAGGSGSDNELTDSVEIFNLDTMTWRAAGIN